MEWKDGREMTKREREELENIVNTNGMKMFICRNCEGDFASTQESFKDGYCGICEMEVRQELKDSHGLEGIMEDDLEEEPYDYRKDPEYLAHLEEDRKKRELDSHTYFGDDAYLNPDLDREEKE